MTARSLVQLRYHLDTLIGNTNKLISQVRMEDNLDFNVLDALSKSVKNLEHARDIVVDSINMKHHVG